VAGKRFILFMETSRKNGGSSSRTKKRNEAYRLFMSKNATTENTKVTRFKLESLSMSFCLPSDAMEKKNETAQQP
jgi:cell division protein FtsL